MDKSTLSNYGWVVIVTLVLSVMLALATPFGGYVGRAVSNVIKYYKTVTGDTFSADYLAGKQGEWDDFLNNTVSSDDIEKDDHIYAIGKTKPEYVLAVFNEDYTHVEIVKNGANSDGLMKNFNSRGSYKKEGLTEEEVDALWEPHASPMSLNRNTLKSAVVKDGVVSLGNSSFSNCHKLETIDFAKTVELLGSSCFTNCSTLKTVIVPEKVTVLPDNLFFECTSLKSITLPDGITSIGQYSIYYCTSLTDFNMPKNLKSIGKYAFYRTKLTNVTLPDGFEILSMSAFLDCVNIETVNIPASTKSIGEATFRRNLSLKSINVDDNNPYYLDEDGVLYDINKTIVLAYPCTKTATSFTLPSTVKRIGSGAFSVTCFKTFTSNNVLEEIGIGAFESSQITSFNIVKSVKKIEKSVFQQAVYLNTITVDPANTNFKIVDNGLYSYDEKTFYCYPANNSSLTTFTMLPTTTTIIDAAFCHVNYLEEITVSENVLTIPEYCFSAARTKTINISIRTTTLGRWCFSSTPNLASLIIPETVTSIHNEAFLKSSVFTTIRGKTGSYAETYANTYGYNFEAI